MNQLDAPTPSAVRRMIPLSGLLVLAALLALATRAMAAEPIQAVQGQVLHLTHASTGEAPKLFCFGIRWPVRPAGDGLWQGWIGIDLKQKPGHYQILWKDAAGQSSEKLQVVAGKFRISHIQVEKRMAEFDKPTLERIRNEARALKATYLAEVDASPAVEFADYPVQGVISTPFGAQRFVNGEPRSPHSGLDIAAAAGTPVHLPLGGKVLLVADMYLNGRTVAIGHGNGLVSVYSHMQSVAVSKGEWLNTGAVIGKVGATGRATGPHLHWGIRFNNARVNPESLLRGAS